MPNSLQVMYPNDLIEAMFQTATIVITKMNENVL